MSRLSMTTRTALVLHLALFGVGACATSSVAPRAYLLSAASASAASGPAAGPVVGVGPVAIPEYLDRASIVLLNGGEEVTLSDAHQWAEPLRAGVPRVLAENLSAMVPTDAVAVFPWRTPWTVHYRVTLEILRFDGPLGGPAVLHARWRLLDGAGRELALRAVRRREAVSEPGHAALVAAQSRLLAGVSRDIAAEIRARQASVTDSPRSDATGHRE
jgi:hypothetical protein